MTIYGHYDVVPAGEGEGEGGWESEPFVMKGMDGYLYGRGVTDNKGKKRERGRGGEGIVFVFIGFIYFPIIYIHSHTGPILAALFAVKEMREQGQLNVNVNFIVEGEEECDSAGFQTAIQNNR